MPEESYITLVLPFDTHGEDACMLLKVARLFRMAVLKLFDAMKGEEDLRKTSLVRKYRAVAYKLLRNRRYADGAIDLVRSVILSARALEVALDEVEFKDWLLFQSEGERAYGNKNITLRADLSVAITVGNRQKIVIKPTVAKNYREILSKLVQLKLPYYARVVIKRFGERKGILRLHGEVHIAVRASEYYSLVGVKNNEGRNFAGLDVNVDRMNLAIVDREGNLLDTKTFWFRYARMRPINRRMVWSDIGEKIHAMLRYAYNHGVKVLSVENPDVLGRLATIWRRKGERKNRDWNFLVNSFRVSIIGRVMLKAPLYGIIVRAVNPAGTSNSKEHKKAMKEFGLDKHTASAYLIALRGLR